jgi:membrane-associated protein
VTDAVLHFAADLMASWWIYLIVLAVSTLDGFLPVVPSESVVVTAGVFAAHGAPNLYGVMAVAAVGAFVGDHVSYLLGRFVGARLLMRLKPGSKKAAIFDWAARALAERGGLVLVVARYIPGGRTAVTLTMGTVRYPLRSFSAFAGLAAVSWAAYSAVIGYVGGMAFESNPLYGMLLGIGLAMTVTVAVELIRYHRKRRTTPEAVRDDRTLTAADRS